MIMTTSLNAPTNLAEAASVLNDIIPRGCYAEVMGLCVWVEQEGNGEFAILSLANGEPVTDINLTQWGSFDEKKALVAISSINSWMEKPVFGLLRAIDGFEGYPRKMFVKSNVKSHLIVKHDSWELWVMTMYDSMRKLDVPIIPARVLPVMRDILLQK